METKKKRRWWLIALVVACCGVAALVVLGIVAAIVIPAWLSSPRAAKEAVALRTFNTIATEERTYLYAHDSYATFDQLIADGALDKRFAGTSPVVDGYIFRLNVTPKTGATPPAFAVNADPQQSEGFNATGRHHYYMDSPGGNIHRSEDRPATADDPVLEER
jgi:type II secretory pathway pseudopilin PulG